MLVPVQQSCRNCCKLFVSFYRKLQLTKVDSISNYDRVPPSIVLSFPFHRAYRVKAEDRIIEDLIPPLSQGEASLRTLLRLNYSKARLIVNQFPEFRSTKHSQISSTFSYLVENVGVSVDRILKHPWLLLIPPDLLQQKIDVAMSILPVNDAPTAVPFISLTQKRLFGISSLWKKEAKTEPALIQRDFCNRMEYLAYHLHTSQVAISDCMAKVKNLPTVPLKKLETVLNLLLAGGVNPIDIEDDPWIFLHNTDLMKQRLEDANKRELPEIKPWMLRCAASKYESYVERTLKEQKVKLKDENIERFLQRRLNWSDKCVTNILWKIPSIGECKASRLEMMISFLLSKGFTPEDIAAAPRILRQSVATVAQRLAELSEFSDGNQYPDRVQMLGIMCRSKSKYHKFISSVRAKVIQLPPQTG